MNTAEALLWQPSASIAVLRQRALLMMKIRQFFTQRHYLEVETPVMGHFGITDVYLNNVTAYCLGQKTYLQTSPEYPMKRLLAAGSGPIFQIARVFRDDELGRWHNPEFTLLEWYQLDIDHHALMREVGELLQIILGCGSLVSRAYREVWMSIIQCCPFTSSLDVLQDVLKHYNLDQVLSPDETDRDQFLFLIMTHVIEPALAQEEAPIAIYGYPATQAALAIVEDGVASRFEVYFRGVELANGFHELTDGFLQQKRFAADRALRQQKGLEDVAMDPLFLNALSAGLPSCSGVALGLDRLLMFAMNQQTISDVVAFDWVRA